MANSISPSVTKKNFLQGIKRFLRDWIPFGRLSFSQEGEDLVLERLMGMRTVSGFFVDIGAHHPTRYSNTYYFYRRGWCGINIDPLPGTCRRFARLRPRDITIECGVSSEEGMLTYHEFNEPALNTFSAEEASRKAVPPYSIIKRTLIPVHPLATILDRYLPEGVLIDFLTIDAEGLDHEVVVSNDWTRYRPAFVLVECLDTRLDAVVEHKTAKFLQQVGYVPCAKTLNTVFFTDTMSQKV